MNHEAATRPTFSTDVKPKFDGELVVLGGHEFIVPALSVKQGRELWPDLMAAEQNVTVENLPEKWGQMMPIVTAAFKRNYPEITSEELEELIDLANLRKIILIIAGQSGLKASPGAVPVARAA